MENLKDKVFDPVGLLKVNTWIASNGTTKTWPFILHPKSAGVAAVE